MAVVVNHIPENWHPENFNTWIEKINEYVKATKYENPEY